MFHVASSSLLYIWINTFGFIFEKERKGVERQKRYDKSIQIANTINYKNINLFAGTDYAYFMEIIHRLIATDKIYNYMNNSGNNYFSNDRAFIVPYCSIYALEGHVLYDKLKFISFYAFTIKEIPIIEFPKSLDYINFCNCAIHYKANILVDYIDGNLWTQYGYNGIYFDGAETILVDNNGEIIDIENSFSIHEYDGPMEYLRLRTKMLKRKVDIISDWFLDCKYNPKYKYCRDRLEKEHGEIYSS